MRSRGISLSVSIAHREFFLPLHPSGLKPLNPCKNDVQLFFSFGDIVIRVDPKSLAVFLMFF